MGFRAPLLFSHPLAKGPPNLQLGLLFGWWLGLPLQVCPQSWVCPPAFTHRQQLEPAETRSVLLVEAPSLLDQGLSELWPLGGQPREQMAFHGSPLFGVPNERRPLGQGCKDLAAHGRPPPCLEIVSNHLSRVSSGHRHETIAHLQELEKPLLISRGSGKLAILQIAKSLSASCQQLDGVSVPTKKSPLYRANKYSTAMGVSIDWPWWGGFGGLAGLGQILF